MTYLNAPMQAQAQAQTQNPLPVLQIAPNAPVQVQMPLRRASPSGGGGNNQLNSQALGQRLAAYLMQKYGTAGAAGSIDNLGTLGDEPLINEILAGGGNGALSSIDALGTLGDEPLIKSMGFGA